MASNKHTQKGIIEQLNRHPISENTLINLSHCVAITNIYRNVAKKDTDFCVNLVGSLLASTGEPACFILRHPRFMPYFSHLIEFLVKQIPENRLVIRCAEAVKYLETKNLLISYQFSGLPLAILLNKLENQHANPLMFKLFSDDLNLQKQNLLQGSIENFNYLSDLAIYNLVPFCSQELSALYMYECLAEDYYRSAALKIKVGTTQVPISFANEKAKNHIDDIYVSMILRKKGKNV
ncbi:hypothetical protein [Oenococcus sicerae]|uniref:hypothetical protein n=1 Tax=Oenococcus sicerae TaxID=2203724 RepID=UPI0010B0DB65|nr:hypothetical protein OAL24_00676 [Oenococcus sicerae]